MTEHDMQYIPDGQGGMTIICDSCGLNMPPVGRLYDPVTKRRMDQPCPGRFDKDAPNPIRDR